MNHNSNLKNLEFSHDNSKHLKRGGKTGQIPIGFESVVSDSSNFLSSNFDGNIATSEKTSHRKHLVKELESERPSDSSFIINYANENIQEAFNNIVKWNKIENLNENIQEAYNNVLKRNKIENFIEYQDFEIIKKNYSRLNPFKDKEFPTTNQSVFFTRKLEENLKKRNKIPSDGKVVWKRAKTIFSNGNFVLDDKGQFTNPKNINRDNYKIYFDTTDLDQGLIGNCWFISAATGLIQNYNLFSRVVPFDNTFDDNEYCGAFHFRFWIYGVWKDVVIDDYLPVDPYNNKSLIFAKNHQTPNEFWCALLEKAYAKVCGSYEAMNGGFMTDALIDMSGGIDECYYLRETRRSLKQNKSSEKQLDYTLMWDVLKNARKKESVIGCNIDCLPSDNGNEMKMSNGLVRGHAYVFTKLAILTISKNGKNEEHKIVRLYNPWGNDVEWNGLWSDKSDIWKQIDNKTKALLEYKKENDGQFWMPYEEWINNFDWCQICNLTPEIANDIPFTIANDEKFLSNILSMWQCKSFHGKWEKGISAGGNGYHSNSYWTNPQFAFYINQEDIGNKNTCYCIIGLMQKDTRRKRIYLQTSNANEYIQFRLYRVRNSETYNRSLLKGKKIDPIHLERIGSSGSYENRREVTSRFPLSQGAYIVIPSTYEENTEGEFMLRIFTEIPLRPKECGVLYEMSFDHHIKSSHSLEASKELNLTDNDSSDLERKDVTIREKKKLKEKTCNIM